MKRYAIVRVDGNFCPLSNDKNFKIHYLNFCADRFKCKDCRYGDTKEQLIKKIMTALRKNLKVDVCSYKYKGKMMKLETIRFKGKGRFDETVVELEQLATKIVEFLGVE